MTIKLTPIVSGSKIKWYKPQNVMKFALNSKVQNSGEKMMLDTFSFTSSTYFFAIIEIADQRTYLQ